MEHEGPITSDASRYQNFTNEGGYLKRFRFLKNIMGLWMIQSIRRELNGVSYVAGKGASSSALPRRSASATWRMLRAPSRSCIPMPLSRTSTSTTIASWRLRP